MKQVTLNSMWSSIIIFLKYKQMCYKNNCFKSHYNITCNKFYSKYFTLNVTITATKISFYNSNSSYVVANIIIIESLHDC